MPTKPINNSTQLNRRFNRLADHLDTAKKVTDATWDKFETKFLEKLQAIQEFVSMQEDNDALMERIEHFTNRFNEAKERIRPVINERLERWTNERVKGIKKAHAAWDDHVAARPERMAQIAEENAALAEQPIQSNRQKRKAIGEEHKAQRRLDDPSVVGKEKVKARETVEQKENDVDQFLKNPAHRGNPKDEKLYREREELRQHKQKTKIQATDELKTELEKQIDERIVLLSDALFELQKTPALSDMGKHMAQKIAKFQLSDRDPKALETLKTELKGLMNKEPKVRDKLIHRIWHHIVTTIKAFLHCLDKLQSKMTGHMIDKQGREHFFKTPKLPIKDALAKFDKALEKVTEDMAEINNTRKLLP